MVASDALMAQACTRSGRASAARGTLPATSSRATSSALPVAAAASRPRTRAPRPLLRLLSPPRALPPGPLLPLHPRFACIGTCMVWFAMGPFVWFFFCVPSGNRPAHPRALYALLLLWHSRRRSKGPHSLSLQQRPLTSDLAPPLALSTLFFRAHFLFTALL